MEFCKSQVSLTKRLKYISFKTKKSLIFKVKESLFLKFDGLTFASPIRDPESYYFPGIIFIVKRPQLKESTKAITIIRVHEGKGRL